MCTCLVVVESDHIRYTYYVKIYHTHFIKADLEVIGSHKLTTCDHSKTVASQDVLLNISSLTWSNHQFFVYPNTIPLGNL